VAYKSILYKINLLFDIYWYTYHLYICQGTSTRRQERELFGLELSFHLFTSYLNQLKVEASR